MTFILALLHIHFAILPQLQSFLELNKCMYECAEKRTRALVAYSRTLSLYLFETTEENCEIRSHSRTPELRVCLSAVLLLGFLRIS